MSFVFIGIPVLVLTASKTGNATAAPAVMGLAAAYFVARLIIKKLYPDDNNVF